MDIFRIKNNNRIIKLTENSFQKETDRKYPYVQTINGEKKYYAICPHCGNPVIIVITPLKNKHKLINLHTAPLDV